MSGACGEGGADIKCLFALGQDFALQSIHRSWKAYHTYCKHAHGTPRVHVSGCIEAGPAMQRLPTLGMLEGFDLRTHVLKSRAQRTNSYRHAHAHTLRSPQTPLSYADMSTDKNAGHMQTGGVSSPLRV